MCAATRILTEELAWLCMARARVVADLQNPRVPVEISRDHISRLTLEIVEVEDALMVLTGDVAQPFQPVLPTVATADLVPAAAE